jgi:hypothetical protein
MSNRGAKMHSEHTYIARMLCLEVVQTCTVPHVPASRLGNRQVLELGSIIHTTQRTTCLATQHTD